MSTQPVMPTYKRLPVTFTHGEGSWLFDTAGRRYLDALAGIAVCGLGHAHPAVTRAITEQAGRLLHTSNLYTIAAQQELAERLTDKSYDVGWSYLKLNDRYQRTILVKDPFKPTDPRVEELLNSA